MNTLSHFFSGIYYVARGLRFQAETAMADNERLRARVAAQEAELAAQAAVLAAQGAELAALRAAAGAGERSEPPLVALARTAVETHLDDDGFGVEALASELALSRSQLHRRMKAEAGCTPVAFIRDLRLEHGRTLLEEGAQSVQEVAFAVGFNSPSYFARCFRHRYGLTPSAL